MSDATGRPTTAGVWGVAIALWGLLPASMALPIAAKAFNLFWQFKGHLA